MPKKDQPLRTVPFLPREWLQRYDAIRITRGGDGEVLELPVGSSILSFLDYNPRWFIDRLVETKGAALFTLGLDLTNSCTDACPMCFTMDKRLAEGLNLHLDVDLTLRRIAELKHRYPETFRLVMMSGSGEPLNLPGIERLLDGVAGLGLAIRVYTAGKKLRVARVREALLKCAVAVRVSIDAVDERTFLAVHKAENLAERLESVRTLAADRNATGGTTLIGVHFVIQKQNFRQIHPFAQLARSLGCDFVSFSQETYGRVAGGFDAAEFREIIDGLGAAQAMHDDSFGVMVPMLTSRPTVIKYDKEYLADVSTLNRCHHSRQHVFFGVRTDFSACCLAGMDTDFRKASYVGPLSADQTMLAVHTAIEQGVGSSLGRPAKVSCNACMFNPYNAVLDRIFAFLDGQPSWDCALLPYVPGRTNARNYEFVIGGVGDAVLAAPSAPASR